ncbi:MAG: hypothetical protein JWM92_607 [Candidatus Nomurabacteria bacterium]|nr:hypothetical protein [Candidatus Nomurabacteria bacterium]
MIRGILLIGAVVILFEVRNILLLVIVSIVIASFVEAWVRMFKEHGIDRTLSVPLIFLVVVGILATLFYTFVPVMIRELSGLLTALLQYLPNTPTVTNQSIQSATQFVASITQHASFADILGSIKNATGNLSQGATTVIGTTFGGLVDVVLVTVMSFYLSIQEKGIESFLRILTPLKHERYVISLWHRTQHKIGLWFKGQLMLGLIIGAIVTVVLALLGVQYAFLIGVISGIAELVPFGIYFAAVPAVLFAVIDGGALLGLKVFIFYIVAQQIENYVLSPVVAHRTVGIPPLVVLLSFLFGITVAGFWGALIAIPVAVFILEYLSDVEKEKLVPITTNNTLD